RGQAHPPSRPPRQLVQRVRVRMNDQIRRAGPDAEPLVVRDGRVHRIQPQDEIRHHGAALEGLIERARAQRLAAEGPVDVGDTEEDELGVLAGAGHGAATPDSSRLMVRSTSSMVVASRSAISPSSPSVLVNAGARRTWSPAYPSACGWVDVTSRP